MKYLKLLITPTLLGLAIYLNIPALTTFLLCLLWVVIVVAFITTLSLPKLLAAVIESGDDKTFEKWIEIIGRVRSKGYVVANCATVATSTGLLIALSAPVTAVFYLVVSFMLFIVMKGLGKLLDAEVEGECNE